MAEARSVEVDKLEAEIALLEKVIRDNSCVHVHGICTDTSGVCISYYDDDSPAETLRKKKQDWAQIMKVQSAYKKIFALQDEIMRLKKSRIRSGNGVPTGPFAFTITKSTKDAYNVGDMLAAVRKVMRQKSCPVVKYAWYYEDKGRDVDGNPIHPHIHGMYETASGGRIEKKHWKRAWPIWDESIPMGSGFRGGYHRPVRDNESYVNYIKKDGGMSEQLGLENERTE